MCKEKDTVVLSAQEKERTISPPVQSQVSLETRMNEQSKFFQVTSPPPELTEKLRKLGDK